MTMTTDTIGTASSYVRGLAECHRAYDRVNRDHVAPGDRTRWVETLNRCARHRVDLVGGSVADSRAVILHAVQTQADRRA